MARQGQNLDRGLLELAAGRTGVEMAEEWGAGGVGTPGRTAARYTWFGEDPDGRKAARGQAAFDRRLRLQRLVTVPENACRRWGPRTSPLVLVALAKLTVCPGGRVPLVSGLAGAGCGHFSQANVTNVAPRRFVAIDLSLLKWNPNCVQR